MQTTNTDRIVLRVLGGEIDAYAELVRRHQQEVWRIVAALLLDTQQAEDMVQRAFIQAYQQLHRFRPGHDFGPWIKEIARNVVRQEVRRRLREDTRLEHYHNHWVALADSTDSSAREDRLAAALQECTRQLPPVSARLLELRYERALGFAEIATSIGRTVEATRQQLARIRLALRDCINRQLARP